jgi:hypothetical protein
VLLMLIDTRGEPPEPDPEGSSQEPWLLSFAGWLFPWPAVILWLLAAALTIDSWVSVGFAFAAFVVIYRRFALMFPRVGGLKDYKQ